LEHPIYRKSNGDDPHSVGVS